MLNTDQILRILHESALWYRHDIHMIELRGRELSNRDYAPSELDEFKRDLIETGNTIRMLLLEYTLSVNEFRDFIADLSFPILLFKSTESGIQPILLTYLNKKITTQYFTESETVEFPLPHLMLTN